MGGGSGSGSGSGRWVVGGEKGVRGRGMECEGREEGSCVGWKVYFPHWHFLLVEDRSEGGGRGGRRGCVSARTFGWSGSVLDRD